MPYKLSIIGSGNFGSCIARHCAANIKNVQGMDTHIKMWVLEEIVNGESLINTINTTHENVKYLPGYNLGENVEAIGDVSSAAMQISSSSLSHINSSQLHPKR